MSSADWTRFPPSQRLHSGQVWVWKVDLDQPEEVVSALEAHLSTDELERAGRFYFDYLRRRFIVSRGALRASLGTVQEQPPAGIKFDYAKHGKPFLKGSPIRFNVSHAHELALIAVSLEREIGVDIEREREMEDGDAIAKRFFSQREVEAYFTLDKPARKEAFFRCWTRKEAYIKAIGEGLSYPLDQFEVSLLPGAKAELLAVYPNPQEVQRWKMANLEPGEGYAGAVIAEGQEWELGLYTLDLRDFLEGE